MIHWENTLNIPSEKQALILLKKAGCSQSVKQHCKAVSKLATKIAQKIIENGISVDINLVKIGGLLHDIGRAKTHTIQHGIVGIQIAHEFKLPESIILIIERHVGTGITEEDAAKLGLPKKNYLPQSLEEKIVLYADKLIEGKRELQFNEALERFSTSLGRFLGSKSIERFEEYHDELLSLMGSKS